MNLSLTDSSVKRSKKDMVNLHHPASPRGGSNEEACRSGTEEEFHLSDRTGTSSELNKKKSNNTRYFIIKSLNHQNIQLSIKKGIWATQVMNEPILEEAFRNCGKVILIFSVNMSGFFQGYAQMMSTVGWRRDNIWSQVSGKNNTPWGRSFKVKWLCLNDLPFQNTLHLKNPWNEYKPVKISRDCQELPRDIGEALCELLNSGYDKLVNFKRDGDFNMPMAPSLYPSLLYQHQVEASGYHLPHHAAGSLNNSSAFQGVKQSKHSRINGTTASWMDKSSRFIDTFTEEDILEMTYEEYLEAHARSGRKLHRSVTGPSTSFQKSSSSKERSDESQSASSSKKRTYRQSLE